MLQYDLTNGECVELLRLTRLRHYEDPVREQHYVNLKAAVRSDLFRMAVDLTFFSLKRLLTNEIVTITVSVSPNSLYR